LSVGAQPNVLIANYKCLRVGQPIFIRLFKEERMREIWVKSDSNEVKLFKDYEICNFSSDLGPKLKEGDRQSPEGFYSVGAKAINQIVVFISHSIWAFLTLMINHTREREVI
jgi:murein L,D-transpeptidase YafK